MKLSFCIPTMNRAKFIGETLESIVSQATDETEIVVVDGGSSDNTEAVVASYAQKFPRLRYARSPNSGVQKGMPSNSGFDLDCNHAVEIARGEYCWLMTDDDLVLPGAVAAVLDKASTGAGLIIVDTEIRSLDFTRMYSKARLNLQADRVYEAAEFENLFADVTLHLTFVGAVIINRSEWLSRDKRSYVGTGFIHVGVIFQRPFTEKVVVIARPLVCIRWGNALWGARAFAIWNVNWPSLVWSFKFSDEAKRKVVAREPWRDIEKLVGFRIVGAYSIKQYREVIVPLLKSRWSLLPALLVAWTPILPLKLLAGVRRLIRTGSWHSDYD